MSVVDQVLPQSEATKGHGRLWNREAMGKVTTAPYAIKGKRGSGIICLNGPTARMGVPGDSILIVSYALYEERELARHRPKIIHVNSRNRLRQ